jgi:hypothetical protein
MAKVYEFMVFECECGYYTTKSTNALKHAKTISCREKTMTSETQKFVKAGAIGNSVSNSKTINTSVYIEDNKIINDNKVINNNSINITLAVPDKSAVSAVYDIFNKPEFISEIRGADPQQIPAILFRHTRGICADQKFVKYDSDKNVVVHKDPVTGKDTIKDLKKYRNEYLKESANLFDDDYHIPYAPQNIQRALKDMTKPTFDTGKRKETPISGAQVIKMCASGDHRMYKFPVETKDFYDDVAKNVDVEIKST